MLVGVKLSSWNEAKTAIHNIDQRLVFDTENLDRLLVLETLEDSEYESSYVLLEALDKILGGDWIDLKVSSRYTTGASIALLTEHHENKKD